MGSIARPTSLDYDVIIIGAGISGINSAYRIQTELPKYNYTILESRNAIGGTWDLFRYPGIRSDSDLHTFGFSWRPWPEQKSIVDGTSIRNYVTESAEAYGIDKKIQFHHRVLSADWSSDDQQWSLNVEHDGQETIYTGRFLIFSTGYYDYSTPLQTTIPGLETFQGQRIHPQFWPADLDYTDKKIVIIGSGATAVTLLPVLAERAKQVTMLQRSPTYVMPLPSSDPTGNFLRKFLPTWLSSRIVRWKFLILPYIFFQFCRAYPGTARKIIRKRTQASLPPTTPHDPHFNPRYNPWEQRLCICPDGDFFKAMRKGNADVVTDTIAQVTETGIQTASGKFLNADIIVTATGLKMQLAGGASISLDGVPVSLNSKFLWKSTMVQDVPNLAIIVGYTNASWTLGADAAGIQICRLLKKLESEGKTSVRPVIGKGEEVQGRNMLNLSSTYIEKAKGTLPKAGDRGPWLPRSNYLTDVWRAAYGDLKEGLRFDGEGKKAV